MDWRHVQVTLTTIDDMGLFSDDGSDSTDSADSDSAVPFNEVEEIAQHSLASGIRIVDEEAGVVVYGINSSGGYGAAAVPLKDTELQNEK